MTRGDAGTANDPLRAILILALAPAAGLGIARFAYALILPDMRASLDWSYAEAGFMNTANAAGYLFGALGAPLAARRLRPERVVFLGTLACVIGLAISAATADFALLTAARCLAGVGSALAFVAGGALAAALSEGQAKRGAFLLGLFYAGPGLGILLSGVITPFLLERLGPGSWAAAWAMLAVISLPLLLLLPLARADAGGALRQGNAGRAPLMAMAPVLAGYCAFGAGYIAYMTFMIAWVQDAGGGASIQACFWAAIGGAAMASPWLWSRVVGRLNGGRAVATLTAVTLAGAVLPLTAGGALALLASAIAFGSGLFAVVAATTAFVRRNLPPSSWTGGIAAMTVAFGIGQMAGPVLTGAVSDLAGGALSAGLWTSAGLLAVSAAISFMQRDLHAE